MTKYYNEKNLEKFKEPIEIILGNKKDNISLEQRVYDLKWSILTAIELIEKDNLGKAIKILKRSVYEK